MAARIGVVMSEVESTHRMATDVLEIADQFVAWLKNKGQEDRTVAYSHHPKSPTELVGLCGNGGIMAAFSVKGFVPVSAVSCPKCRVLMAPGGGLVDVTDQQRSSRDH